MSDLIERLRDRETERMAVSRLIQFIHGDRNSLGEQWDKSFALQWVVDLQKVLREQDAEIARLREVEPMAACMAYVRDELVRAGIIGAEVPPMFYPEAIAKIARERDALEDAIFQISVRLGIEREADMDDMSWHTDMIARAQYLANQDARIDNAPRAFMDTRVALGVCALKEEDFQALYALQGKSVALLVLE